YAASLVLPSPVCGACGGGVLTGGEPSLPAFALGNLDGGLETVSTAARTRLDTRDGNFAKAWRICPLRINDHSEARPWTAAPPRLRAPVGNFARAWRICPLRMKDHSH